MSSPVIDITAVSKRYRAATVLHEICAAIPSGEVVGLLGHNGAGKSTLMKLMLGLIRPSSGHLSVLGRSPDSRDGRSARRRIGYLPENVAFYGNLTGHEALDYFGAIKRVAPGERRRLLDVVGLAAAGNRRVRTYSKGMRQRLGLAQALLGDPELLLLDEPTAGLDPQATRDFFTLLAERRARGVSILLSSHVLAEIEPHLDRALILGRGRLLAYGSIDELRTSSGLPVSVVVRLAPGTVNGTRHRLLAGLDAQISHGNPDVVELDVTSAGKMDTLRRLIAAPEVRDIEVRGATLERLYAAVSTAASTSVHGR